MNIHLIFAFVFSVFATLIYALTTSLGISLSYRSTWFLLATYLLVYSFVFPLSDNEGRGQVRFASTSIFILVFLSSIAGSPVFNSDEYAQSVVVKDSNISDFQTEPDNVRKVTLDMAMVLANKIIGHKYNGVQISSQYELSRESASPQYVNGKLVWVIPLDYAGFTKWLSQDHIPGYIVVSATDPKSEPKIVLDKKIRASFNGYFGDDIERKIWFASGAKKTYIHSEIDDKGDVYWIAPIVKPTVFMSLFTVDKVLVMNAETLEYSINTIDEISTNFPWIDRVWPEEIIEQRLEAYGSLQDGWWNTVWGGTNINKPTTYEDSELWLIHTNGKLQWFSGMTSEHADQSLVSGVIVEAVGKNGKPILREIELPGITDEKGAISAISAGLGADGVKWIATLPQPVFVDGAFFWHASIISNNFIYQKAGIVQGNDISNVYFGQSLKDAITSAKSAIAFAKTGIAHTDGTISNAAPKNNLPAGETKEAIIAQMLIEIDKLNGLKAKLQALK